MIVKTARPFTISLANPHSSECGYSSELHKIKPEALVRVST
jgi:hypothetical protein